MSIRHVIKRSQVASEEEAASRPRPAARRSAAPGTRLVELEPGRYAVEHTCRCGEVSILEIETDAPAKPPERPA